MFQQILFGVGVLMLIAIWKYIWVPTALMTARDRLFHLRDRVLRAYFVERGIPLSDPTYRALRDLINGYLRHTESASFWQFVLLSVWAFRHQDVMVAVRDRYQRAFRSKNPETQELAEQVRANASRIMLTYVIEKSVVGWTLIGGVGLVVAIVNTARKAMDTVDMAAYIMVTGALTIAGFVNKRGKCMTQTVLEEIARDDCVAV